MNNEIEHVLCQSYNVRQLIEQLQDMDQDARVLITSNYGDYHKTEQALPISDIQEHESDVLCESAYSHSGIAFNDPNATPEPDEEPDEEPSEDDEETCAVVILSTE